MAPTSCTLIEGQFCPFTVGRSKVGSPAPCPRKGAHSSGSSLAPFSPWDSYRLLPQRMGCRPAQSCTKAENCPWGLSPPARSPLAPSSSTVALLAVALALAQPVLLAVGGGALLVQAPLGRSLASAERMSMSWRTFSISMRSSRRVRSRCWAAVLFTSSSCSCEDKQARGLLTARVLKQRGPARPLPKGGD